MSELEYTLFYTLAAPVLQTHTQTHNTLSELISQSSQLARNVL